MKSNDKLSNGEKKDLLTPKTKQPITTRNIAATQQLFLDTTEELIREVGIAALRITHIAKRAGKSKSLIYQYFKSLDGLLKTFFDKNDYWLSYQERLDEIIEGHRHDNGRELASLILKNHFKDFSSNKLLQQISLLELTDNSDLLYELSNSRERLGEKLFALSADFFRYSGVDIRATEGLLIGGINYIILHSITNGSTFCGIDTKTEEGRNSIRKMIQKIIGWAYDEAQQVKSGKRRQVEIDITTLKKNDQLVNFGNVLEIEELDLHFEVVVQRQEKKLVFRFKKDDIVFIHR